jgi:hypothetical protein
MNSDRINRNYYSDSGRSWGFSVSEKQARYGCVSLSGQNTSNGRWGQIPLWARSQVILVLLMRCFTRRPRTCGNLFLNPRTRSMGREHFVIFACLLSYRWRYHGCYCPFRISVYAELSGEIRLGAAFQRISGEIRRRHDL